ncbi:flagellar biosynthesis, cell-distal portion of basal-body rod [Klebsiella pneumoniae]|nr:flagellar biosynthesis, cell-distal portion of basal-body rod [Klebsiella pneumoniae]STS18271.1 flagellar biosynthesis, cell-distal portion of basal-body rod [Klebsiella pneumoniae]STS40037.1 flagellar biosynthesis, cell-distal portion of basal-body rod [Klebsiella pneumoniae]STS53607.1 flagellar biosynthesis, cell-distal portion of basal-body rod [Klebsiella pneumoniae]STT63196.1 flagellar biosynthesis, cell-distal portion of basal-body rod [Klebsiella pneumoniae]
MAEVPLPTPTDNAVPSTDIRDAVYAGAMLDKVVTSTEPKYTDRLGGEHYTVDGIKAEGDKVVEETRQNLIPLSRQYMTLADAQADIANIPVGAATYVRSADGSSLADEYINNAGALTATGRRMPAQQEVEQAQSAAESAAASAASGLNVLFDPLCEVLLSNPTIGGKTHVPLGTLTASLSTNSKLGFPAIVAGPLAGSVAARTVWLSDCAIIAGDVINVKVTSWYANVGGRVAFVFRNSSGTQLGTQQLQYATTAGVNRLSISLTVPSGAVRLDIRVENTANAGLVELAAAFVMTANAIANPSVPGRPLSPYPVPLSAGAVSTHAIQKKAVTVEKAAFFVPGVNLFDKSAVTPDSYVNASTGTIKTNVTYDASDFIPVVAGNAYTQHYAHQTAYYDANKNYLSGEQASTSPATPRTLTIPTGAAYIRMTVAKTVLNTMQFEKGSEATGYQPYAVQLDPLLIPQTNTAVISDYVERAHQIRVGRMKLSQLESGVSTILTVGIFGDSWPTQPNRFSQPLAKALRAKYGAGPGVGWTSFGRHATSNNIINANVFSPNGSDVLKKLFTWTGNWLFSYSGTKKPTNSSPDTAVVTSSTPGDALKATIPGTSDGGWSTCRLGFVGTRDGVIRYNWDGGEWTTLNVQGSGLQFVDINPPATVNASNVINVEVVSGTVSLCGLNCLATGAGVRVHKLGASGSSLASWLSMDAAAFAAALTELALDTIIILTGTNDQRITGGATAFENNLRSFIARIRAALPGADILFVMPCENERTDNPTTMATMAKRARSVTAELGCAFINLQYIFGDNPADYAYGSVHSWFAEDGIHPDPATGGYLIKDAVFRVLTNR